MLIRTKLALESEMTRELFESVIQNFLAGVPVTKVAELNALRKKLGRIERLKLALTKQAAPPDVVESLLAWVLEHGKVSEERLLKLEEVAGGLLRRFFFQGESAKKWQRLLASSLEPGSPAHEAVARWQAEGVAGKPLTRV